MFQPHQGDILESEVVTVSQPSCQEVARPPSYLKNNGLVGTSTGSQKIVPDRD